jgi:hypothetical protein
MARRGIYHSMVVRQMASHGQESDPLALRE